MPSDWCMPRREIEHAEALNRLAPIGSLWILARPLPESQVRNEKVAVFST
jgi:hypothetical protein